MTTRARRKTGTSLITDELISLLERRAFYSTIVEEFGRLLRPPARASLPWLDFETFSAAE
jgi:hypothetical protein